MRLLLGEEEKRRWAEKDAEVKALAIRLGVEPMADERSAVLAYRLEDGTSYSIGDLANALLDAVGWPE